jgi:signal peptidase II
LGASWRAQAPDGPLSILGVATIGLVVLADQGAKMLAETRLPLGEAIDLLPVLSLFRVHNTGIAFSMFAGSGAFALNVLALAVAAVVTGLWLRSRDGGWPAAIGYALILGGAAGNIIDRLRFGHVIDFLLLHIGTRTLFVFNIADAALTLGPVLLVIVYLWPVRPAV